MYSTSQQRIAIHKLTGYNKDLKAELVLQITKDPKKISTTDLSCAQAQGLINSLTKDWAVFDRENTQHMYILSLCIQAGHSINSPRFGVIADRSWLSGFLKSMKAPVKKPLMEMSLKELSKTIIALEGIVKSTHGKLSKV